MLELCAALLTAAVAVTLVPPVRRLTPRPIEVVVWIGFIAVSFFMVASMADPKAREVTAAVVWGTGQVVGIQMSALQSGLRVWIADHASAIATIVLLGTADAMALALLSWRRHARPHPGVRLNEWFVLPRAAIPVERIAYTPDGLNRRLVAAGRAGVQSVMGPVLTSAAFARLALLALHALGRGHMRFSTVQPAMDFGGPALETADLLGALGDRRIAGTAMPVAVNPRTDHGRRAHHHHHHHRSRRAGAAPRARVVALSPLLATAGMEPAPMPVRARAGEEVDHGVAPQQPRRLAS